MSVAPAVLYSEEFYIGRDSKSGSAAAYLEGAPSPSPPVYASQYCHSIYLVGKTLIVLNAFVQILRRTCLLVWLLVQPFLLNKS